MIVDDCPFDVDYEAPPDNTEEQIEAPVKRRTIILKKPKDPKAQEVSLPPDIVYLDDRSLHGWLDKKPSNAGYFTSWKRVFVTVEHLKLRYFKDQELTTQKGVVDFTKIKATIKAIDDRTFKICVLVKGG